MAIIDGKMPEPPRQETVQRRVVVKFREGVELPEAGSAARLRSARGWEALAAAVPELTLTPYIPSVVSRPQRRTVTNSAEGSPQAAGKSREVLARYFASDVPSGSDAEALAQQFRALDDVESAYVEGGPTPPPVMPADDPRSTNQGYLDAAPNGIDARWAWTIADGTSVGFADMERGWTLNHEDLAAAGITIISGQSRDFHGHGTAVLGEVVGVDNTRGVVGIAPNASARVVSQWRTATNYNTADAITDAAAAMNAGDVLLLEAQTSHPNATGYVPVEVEDAVFDAIRAAVDDGIIVVEAGANGSVDLDAFTNNAGRQILNRSSADFRDSGAILVGAASAAAPHGRLSFSNFGSRIDCFAWGEAIDTCGDGWTGTSTTAYTTGFGGTSGASPIVTGAAILVQSFGKARRGRTYNPGEMRSLLSAQALNTPSNNPAADRIGVMPNLRQIIETQILRDRFRGDRWKLVAKMLFGVTSDGGGVVWIPGQGPVPIDPWGPLMIDQVPVEVRDMLAALAVYEIAGLSENDSSVRAMRKASLSALKRATDQLAAKVDGRR